MISTGLRSVILKDLESLEIIELCVHSKIHKIEWDSFHVPYDDIEKINLVEKYCRINAITTCSYNSNYVFTGNEDFELYSKILNCAKTLKAPVINIYVAERKNLTTEEIEKINSSLREFCKLARNTLISIIISKESLAYDSDSALSIIEQVGRHNLKLCWAPDNELSVEENELELTKIITNVTNVFISNPSENGFLPIIDVKLLWRKYGVIIKKNLSRLHIFLLDGIPKNNLALLSKEVSSLRYILAGIK